MRAKQLFVCFSKVLWWVGSGSKHGGRVFAFFRLLTCFASIASGISWIALEAREAMITPTFSYPGYGAFFRYGVVGSGFVGCPMGVKRNALSLTTLASVDGGIGENAYRCARSLEGRRLASGSCVTGVARHTTTGSSAGKGRWMRPGSRWGVRQHWGEVERGVEGVEWN